MKDPSHITKTDPSAFKREDESADLQNQKTRRAFLQAASLGAAALAAHGVAFCAETVVDKKIVALRANVLWVVDSSDAG